MTRRRRAANASRCARVDESSVAWLSACTSASQSSDRCCSVRRGGARAEKRPSVNVEESAVLIVGRESLAAQRTLRALGGRRESARSIPALLGAPPRLVAVPYERTRPQALERCRASRKMPPRKLHGKTAAAAATNPRNPGFPRSARASSNPAKLVQRPVRGGAARYVRGRNDIPAASRAASRQHGLGGWF